MLDAVGMDAIRRAPAAPLTKRRSASLRKAASFAATPEQEQSQGTRQSAANSGANQPSAQQDPSTRHPAMQPLQEQSADSTQDVAPTRARSGRELKVTQDLDFSVLEPITIVSPSVATTTIGCGGCFPR